MFYTNHYKQACQYCNKLIDVANIKRHEEACLRNILHPKKEKYHVDHNDLFCKFCGKECKSKNSLVQHEIRCKENPNRKNYDSFLPYVENNLKGRNKYNNELINKQAETLKNKYKNGYMNPNKGKKVNINYQYLEHNNKEIEKWILYVKTLNIEILKDYEIFQHPEGYITYYNNNSRKYEFEHNLIADILLNGNFSTENVVHHIDRNRSNNEITNLLIFRNRTMHKKFHKSKYSYLIYNEDDHLFDCVIKKDENIK